MGFVVCLFVLCYAASPASPCLRVPGGLVSELIVSVRRGEEG